MRLRLFSLFLLSIPLYAQSSVSLRNDREGVSMFKSDANDRKMQRALRDFTATELVTTYRDALGTFTPTSICSYDLNSKVKGELLKRSPRFTDYEGVIYYLRFAGEIDDLGAKLLLDADKTVETRLDLPKGKDDLRLPRKRAKIPELVDTIGAFETRFKKDTCLDDAYSSLVSSLRGIDGDVRSAQIEALLVEAHTQRKITTATYMILEKARINEIDEERLTLKSYVQKIQSLRLHKPLRDPNERSDFVSVKADKKKITRRHQLLANYSDIQIMLMGELMKKFKSRLESRRIEIVIHGSGDESEVIPLEPMERFRFAIKLLRKEMMLLSQNTYFNGQGVGYMDLMVASYETSVIAGSELDQLAQIEQIWNPTKSLWEKAEVWVRTFSSVATVALPPPYGFIPALVIVVIEMYADKDKKNENDETTLF